MSDERDATGEVRLDRTQEIELESAPQVPREHEGPREPTWAEAPTPPAPVKRWDPWATPAEAGASAPDLPSPTHPAAAGPTVTVPTAASPAGAPGGPTVPPVPPQPVAPAYSSPGKAPRHGPGWGAVLLVTGLCTLLAGLGGGLLGGWLAANGKMSFTSSTPSTTQGPAPTAGAGATTRPAGSIANIAAKAMPSVVTIEVKSGTSEGTGSGWVLDDQGHIVTNNHVVADAANGGDITVVLSNGKQSKATIVGRDQPYDLAVIKVDRTDLTPLPVGDSSKVVVGDEVIAVGAPLGLESTVTAGIVSALDRPVAAGSASDTSFINAIQTDAAINPGNSGGPLLNMAGEVIGVNSAIATAPGTGSTGQAGSIGVGFAIPSAQVKKTVEQLITKGKAVHPVIGVYLDQEYEGEGVKVRDSLPNGQDPVTANGPAAKAGLKAGDIIVALNGKPVTNPDALVVGIRALDVGDKVTLTVRRGGKDEDVTMVLEASTD